MKKIFYVLLLLLIIISIRVKSQTTTCKYDSVSGNYIISFQQDTLEQLIFRPRIKIVPLIHARINVINDTIKYYYRITNSNLSKQHLSEFYLPNSSTISNIQKPNDDWNLGYHNVIAKLHWSIDKLNHYTPQGEDYYEIGMPPNSSTDGFIYSSKGLPGIIDCHFQGFSLWGSDHELPGDVTDIISNLEAFPLNYVKRITIGSILPPDPLIAIDFLDTLLSYTRQSVQLGWLKSTHDHHCDKDEKPEDGISKNIERRILKAKKELSKGNTIKARRELEQLLKKVERIYKFSQDAEGKKRNNDIVMTSEAYALLKYNTEYLIEQLKKK
jgi:hypothetical protein